MHPHEKEKMNFNWIKLYSLKKAMLRWAKRKENRHIRRRERVEEISRKENFSEIDIEITHTTENADTEREKQSGGVIGVAERESDDFALPSKSGEFSFAAQSESGEFLVALFAGR
ncbi:hypothetical protein TNCV_4063831 [Trichonephila clavipes]|nr:hypothetical protein TNCV_4063831 [Trichonephila clavipes]